MPRDLYFSKALFEGLIFGGAFIRREISGILEFGIHSVESRIQECPGLLYIRQKRRVLTAPGIIKKLV